MKIQSCGMKEQVGILITVLQVESWNDTKVLRKSTIMGIRQCFKTTENKTSPQSKLICMVIYLKRGRKRNCPFQMVSRTLRSPRELTRDVSSEALAVGRGGEHSQDLHCQGDTEQCLSCSCRGLRRTGRERPACRVFLLRGDILAFWVWKIIVSECCPQLLTALPNSVSRGWIEKKCRLRE